MGAAPRVAVVGAGICGLAAALALTDSGDLDVTVFDGEDRVGGKIRGSSFAGVDGVDEGPDAFLSRVPEAVDLARRVGLGDDLVSPEPVGAAVWHDGLHPIPDGLMLGMPGRITPLISTRLLSWRGKARAAIEPLLPRTSTESDSIGEFVRARFGDEVQDRMVDALVGSIYATDTDNFSLAEMPQLAVLAQGNRSVLFAARRQRRSQAGTATAAASPIFATPRGGMSALIDATRQAVADAGGTFRPASSVTGIEPAGSRWMLSTSEPDQPPTDISEATFDAVIIATSAPAAGTILTDAAPEAAQLLARAETADVIMVTMHIGADQWPERLHGLSGYLVPKPDQHTVTAVSFASQKWRHWRPPSGGEILRVSLGRDGVDVLHLDDHEVLGAVLADLQRHLGIAFAPLQTRITRWPGAFAQYRPHHAEWVTAIEQALPGGVFVAGAGYRGIGIPACVRSGVAVAGSASEHVRHLPESPS